VNYKRGLAVVIGCAVAALVSLAATWPRFHPAAPAESSTANPGAQPRTTVPPVRALVADLEPLPSHDDPLAWQRLSDAQHVALAPFASEWDKFSEARRRKWLRIAARYPKLSPDAQKRLHARMTEWVGMTPEQRRIARENYQASKALPPQARKKAWTAYQQLSPEQKAKLAASERRRRPTVVSVPPTGKAELRDIDRLVNARERATAARHAPGVASQAGGAGADLAPHAATTASAPAPGSAAPAAPATDAPVQPADQGIYKGSLRGQ